MSSPENVHLYAHPWEDRPAYLKLKTMVNYVWCFLPDWANAYGKH